MASYQDIHSQTKNVIFNVYNHFKILAVDKNNTSRYLNIFFAALLFCVTNKINRAAIYTPIVKQLTVNTL
jgi:hypothetical protein